MRLLFSSEHRGRAHRRYASDNLCHRKIGPGRRRVYWDAASRQQTVTAGWACVYIADHVNRTKLAGFNPLAPYLVGSAGYTIAPTESIGQREGL